MSSNEDNAPMVVLKKKKKKSNSVRLWLSIDATGQQTLLEFDKYKIMRRVHISVRDIMILDRDNTYPCTIVGRDKAIVLHMEDIKMIITAEEVLLLNPLDPSLRSMIEELRRYLHVESKVSNDDESRREILDAETDEDEKDESPFEFRALKVVLEATCGFLYSRTAELETVCYPALDELTSKINSLNLERVHSLKRRIPQFKDSVQKVRDEIERLMENDNDLAELYLSRKLACPSSTEGSTISRAKRTDLTTAHGVRNDVEEVQMLLEPYYFQINDIKNKISTLQEYIDDTEDYINTQLDNARNQLIKFELVISSASICLTVYSLVAGILGMNIPNSWYNQKYMFKWELSDMTAIKAEDILCSLQSLELIQYRKGQYVICADPKVLDRHLKAAGRGGLDVDVSKLIWTPYKDQS